MASVWRRVETDHHALAERFVCGSEPVEHGHQAVAAGRVASPRAPATPPAKAGGGGLAAQVVAEKVEEPAERPHAPADAVALVKVSSGTQAKLVQNCLASLCSRARGHAAM